jgi:hypothetical protein
VNLGAGSNPGLLQALDRRIALLPGLFAVAFPVGWNGGVHGEFFKLS